MAIKIDLEKAYDKIEWAFIRKMLIAFNFPDNIIDLIMSCVSSVSTSLIFNGGCLESFLPSQGIRQGNPLSPYLYILYMEYLGYLIEEKCEAKLWSLVRALRSGPAFSHIFFANDLVFFPKADQANCYAIKEVLEVFCKKSGQNVSEAKSQVYFSPNVNSDSRDSLANVLGFRLAPNLGKYLGFPHKHSSSGGSDFDFVLDIVKKEACWLESKFTLHGG